MNAYREKIAGGLALSLIGLAAFFATAEPAQANANSVELKTVLASSTDVVETKQPVDWEFTSRSRSNRCQFTSPSQFSSPGSRTSR